MQEKEETPSPHHPLLLEILAKELGCKVQDIVDFELNVCDTQDGVIGGDTSSPPPRQSRQHTCIVCVHMLQAPGAESCASVLTRSPFWAVKKLVRRNFSVTATHPPTPPRRYVNGLWTCREGSAGTGGQAVTHAAPAGAHDEFVFVGRLDNLAMSFCSIQALVDAFLDAASLEGEAAVKAVALFDHEEVGSASAQGGASPLEVTGVRDAQPFKDLSFIEIFCFCKRPVALLCVIGGGRGGEITAEVAVSSK